MPKRRQDAAAEPETGYIAPEQPNVGSPEPMVPFQFRMRPSLKEALERAAEQNSRSVNAEIHHRVEASLVDEARRAQPEPELEDLMQIGRTAFIRGGALAARAQGLEETPQHWLRDPVAYRAAVHQMSDTLMDLAAPVQGKGGPAAKALADNYLAHLADRMNEAIRRLATAAHELERWR